MSFSNSMVISINYLKFDKREKVLLYPVIIFFLKIVDLINIVC